MYNKVKIMNTFKMLEYIHVKPCSYYMYMCECNTQEISTQNTYLLPALIVIDHFLIRDRLSMIRRWLILKTEKMNTKIYFDFGCAKYLEK